MTGFCFPLQIVKKGLPWLKHSCLSLQKHYCVIITDSHRNKTEKKAVICPQTVNDSSPWTVAEAEVDQLDSCCTEQEMKQWPWPQPKKVIKITYIHRSTVSSEIRPDVLRLGLLIIKFYKLTHMHRICTYTYLGVQLSCR